MDFRRFSPVPKQALDLSKNVFVAGVGGFLGALINIPGGSILGALVLVGAVRLSNILSLAPLPKSFSFYLQVLAGILLGVKINSGQPLSIHEILIPAFLGSLALLLAALVIALIVTKLFKWDLTTAWLACSPGRMQDMIIIANDIQVDTVKVTVTHVVRMILIVSISPLILYFLK